MTLIRRTLTHAAIAALVTGTVLGRPAAAQNPAPQEKKAPEVAGVKQVNPNDPHAGHNHGPQEVPKPTVVLKPGEKPGIKFDEPIYDFGRIRAGADVEHEYWFTNTGNGPLEILQVKPSCGCTVAGQYTKIVQPGETGKIPVKLGTKNVTGPMNKSIRVSTNVEGAEATVNLQIKGEVWQAIEVTPRTVAFGRITADAALSNPEKKVTIMNNVEGQLTLGEVTSTNPNFTAKVTPIEPGKKFEMTVTLVPPIKPGNISGQLTMTTGMQDMPTLSVQVYAFVVPAIEVSPARVTLTPGRTEPQTVHMYVRSNVGKPFSISDLKATNEAVKLELTDVKDSQTYRLKVDVPASFKPSQSDQITFATNDPTIPSLTIPIVEMGRPSPVTARPTPINAAGATPATATFQPPAAKPAAAQPAKATEDTKAAQNTQAAKDASGAQSNAGAQNKSTGQ